jgi:DNA-binding beta-propeller fold protein YncE
MVQMKRSWLPPAGLVVWLTMLPMVLSAERIYLGSSWSGGSNFVVDVPAGTVMATVSGTGSSVVFAPDGSRGWAFTRDSSRFLVELDTARNIIIRGVPRETVGPTFENGLVLSRRTNRLLVPMQVYHGYYRGFLRTYDVTSLRRMSETLLGSCPSTVALSPDESVGYVFDGCSGELLIIDGVSFAVRQTVRVSTPYLYGGISIAASRDGQRVYVPDKNGNAVLEVDTQSLSIVQHIAVAPPIDPSQQPPPASKLESFRLSPDDRRLYILVGGKMQVWDVVERRWVVSLPGVRSVAFANNGGIIWVAMQSPTRLVALETTGFTQLAEIPVPAPIESVSIAPDTIPRCVATASTMKDRFHLSRSGYRFNYATSTFTQVLTITNVSGGRIEDGVSVVFTGLSPKGSLLGRYGSTVCRSPAGDPFMQFTNYNSWSPGQTRMLLLQFSNPEMRPIQYGTEILGNGNH